VPRVPTRAEEAAHRRRARAWMRALAPYRTTRFALDADRAALLVVDAQRYFLEARSRGRMAWSGPVTERIRELQVAFRDRGRPVVMTRHAHAPDGSDGGNLAWWWGGLLREGLRSSELLPALLPLPGDSVVAKRTYSAFLGTDLEAILARARVRDLVVAGVVTGLCVETTVREAFCRGYRVKVVADACSTKDARLQLGALRAMAHGFADVCLARDIIGEL
jgi:nicotinamidase-related amidase